MNPVFSATFRRGLLVCGLLIASGPAQPSRNVLCPLPKLKKANTLHEFNCRLTGFEEDYIELIKKSQVWALNEGGSAQPEVVRTRHVHWQIAHLKALLSGRLRHLELKDNGVTVDLRALEKSPKLETLILNGSDVIKIGAISSLLHLRHLGWDITSNENYVLETLIGSLSNLKTIELSGILLEHTPIKQLAALLRDSKSLTKVVFLFDGYRIKRNEILQPLRAKADSLIKILPALKVELAASESSEGIHDNP